MGHVRIAHLHMCHHRLRKRQQKDGPGQGHPSALHLQRLHHIEIGRQHQHIRDGVGNHANQVPVLGQPEQRRHHELRVQKAEFRGIVPFLCGEYMPALRQQPGKNHLSRHVGIQPVILAEDIQEDQSPENHTQNGEWPPLPYFRFHPP